MLSASINPTGERLLAVALWCDGRLLAIHTLNPGKGQFKQRLEFYLDGLQDYWLATRDKLGQQIENAAIEVWRPDRGVNGMLGPAKMAQLTGAIQNRLNLLSLTVLAVESPVSHRPVAKRILKELRLADYQRNIASVMTGIQAGFGLGHKDVPITTKFESKQSNFLRSMETLYENLSGLIARMLNDESPALKEVFKIKLLAACAELSGVPVERRRELQAFTTKMNEVFRQCEKLKLDRIDEDERAIKS